MPVKNGNVFIQKKGQTMTVKADKDGGKLIFQGKEYPLAKEVAVTVSC